MGFSTLLEIMHARGITTLSGIAQELGVSPQSISNWKARDQVPYKYVLEVQNRFGNVGKNRYVSKELKREQLGSAGIEKPVGPQPLPYHLEEDTISLSDVLLVIAKQIRLIIIPPLITVFLALIYTQFIQQPMYTSRAKLLLPQEKPSSSGLTGLASRFGVGIPPSEQADLSSASLYPELINSRTFAGKLLNKQFYTERFRKQLTLLAILTHGEEEPVVGLDTLILQVANTLPEMIKFKEEGSFSILEVETFEPQLAADIANAVLEELEKLNRKFKSQFVSEKQDFIENRIQTVEKDLERSELALKYFRETNRQIANSPALLLEQERLARDVEIQQGVYLTLKQQLELAKIEEVQESSIVQVLDYPHVPFNPSNKRTKLVAILSGLLGVGLGVVMAFVKGYTENADEEEKKKIGEVKTQFRTNIRGLLADRKITATMSVLLLIGLPFLLGHESRNPEFFGRYSLKALVILSTYVVVLLASVLAFLYGRKMKLSNT